MPLIRDYIAGHERAIDHVDEHRALAGFLANLDIRDPADQQRIRDEADELRTHIAKEEDGCSASAD